MKSSLNWISSTGVVIAIVVGLSPFATAQSGTKEAESAKGKPTPVKIESSIAKLAPENTKIEFIGTHVGEDKKPRLGGFAKFGGAIKVNDKQISSISVDIDMTSIWTEFDKLTGHLKTADFFNIEKFAEAKFESTSIQSDKEGQMEVTGNLTLLGTKKEIKFPVSVKMMEGGLLLTGKFQIDRTSFGMEKMTQGVDKEVTIMVSVGEKTMPKKSN